MIPVESELILERRLLERRVLPSQIDPGRLRPGNHAFVRTLAARVVNAIARRHRDAEEIERSRRTACAAIFGRWMLMAASTPREQHRELGILSAAEAQSSDN